MKYVRLDPLGLGVFYLARFSINNTPDTKKATLVGSFFVMKICLYIFNQ